MVGDVRYMKKINKVLLLTLLAILPLNIKALEFIDGNTKYIMTERDFSCTQNLDLIFSSSNGVFIYADFETNELYRVTDDDKCVLLTIQEELDLRRKYFYEGYHIIGDTPSDNKIYNINDELSSYIKTDDTDLIDGKEYYRLGEEDEDGDRHIEIVPDNELNVTDLQNKLYYEQAYMEVPSIAEIVVGTTYYDCGPEKCEEISNPVLDDIANYFIVGQNTYRKDVVATIEPELHSKILSAPIDGYHVFVDKMPNSAYYIYFIDQTTYLVDVYSLNGDLIVENVGYYFELSNGLYAIETDNGVELYNASDKLLYTIPSASNFYQYNTSKDVVMLSWRGEGQDDIYYNMTKTTNINNPATGDNILMIFIVCGISLVCLILLTLYFIKQKRKT